jgi:hypothetical protein
MAPTKLPTRRELDKAFKPYALELGHLVHSWNHLQDGLARLFWRVTGIKDGAVPLAIWHSTPSDLSQRKMLRAAVEVVYANDKRAREDVLWLLDRVDHMLSGKRNNAIHAPVVMSSDGTGIAIKPYDMALNPRAAALEGKAIIAELIWYRETAEVLRAHSYRLFVALRQPRDGAWPDKPALPHLRPPKTAKKTLPAAPRTEPKRPIRSLREK